MGFPRPDRAAVATAALTGLLAGAGLAAALVTPHERILRLAPSASPAVVFGCFVAAFLCAEIALLHVELRQQTYSFSLSGIALLLGLFFCEPQTLVLARLLGAAAVLVWQRLPPLKAAYNLAAYTFETALMAWALHATLGPGVTLTLGTAAVACAILMSADALMSALVLLVISWHQGRVTVAQAVRVFVPVATLGVLSTVAAVLVVALLDEGAMGVTLIGLIAVLGAATYRGYLVLRRRHTSLAVMHEFVQQGVGAASAEELSRTLLARIATLLHAGEAELRLFTGGSDVRLRIRETRDEAVFTRETSPGSGVAGSGDWLLTRVLENAEPLAVPRGTRERGLRQWLAAHGARDAMVVALPSQDLAGVVIVKDRMGEASSFTADDLTLLQTLAGHVVVALRGTQLVEQLRHDATHDALTGLANRVLLTERIEHALTGADGGRQPAVLLLDLDRFKEVNDALGHHVGDAMLQLVATRIRACAPPEATVARLGGDEFAVLLPDSDEAAANAVAEAVFTSLSAPIGLVEAEVRTAASIGIALGADGAGGADVLRHADTAMYAAKAGSAPIVVYTEELDRGRAERLRLLADLHLALERDELVLHYQPQLDLRTDQVTGVEALVRWQHPVHGLLAPDLFIPLAQTSGLIKELTRQVLRKALRQSRRWREDGLDLTVSINMSATGLDDTRIVDDVAAALAAARVPADRLMLEITETAAMGDPARTVPVLQRLSDIGVAVSLDDFGTGYSSLAYLQRLPVSEIKIDRSFVMGLDGPDPQAATVLVRSIANLAGSLGMRVVAEGVETAEVLHLLRTFGCDLAQGYHIARPVPAEDIPALAGRPRRRGLTTVAG